MSQQQKFIVWQCVNTTVGVKKIQQGWKYGPKRDEKKKIHPSLIAWDDSDFSETEKDKDRGPIKMIPRYVQLAGFQIVRVLPKNGVLWDVGFFMLAKFRHSCFDYLF